MRVDNSSMFLSVSLRRLVYYRTPKSIRSWTAMEETHQSVKGKNGAYLEHLSWLFFLYLAKISSTIVPYYVKDYTIITNC